MENTVQERSSEFRQPRLEASKSNCMGDVSPDQPTPQNEHYCVLFIRFTVTQTRNSHESCVQLCLISIFDTNGNKVKVKGVTNPGGRNPPREGPGRVGDGTTNSKWLDFQKQPLIFKLFEPSHLAAYYLVTANDVPGRDPVRWRIEGSSNGETWRLIDDRTEAHQAMPMQRIHPTRFFSFNSLNTSQKPSAQPTTRLFRPLQKVRFITKQTRNLNEGAVQLCLLLFLGTNNKPLRTKCVSNPGGRSPPNEGPDHLQDSRRNTKWLDFRKQPVELTFAKPSIVQSYVFVTANDFPGRDPVRWQIEGSFDGNFWKLLDDRSAHDQTIPLARFQVTDLFGFLEGQDAVATKKDLSNIFPSDRDQMLIWANEVPRHPGLAAIEGRICIAPKFMRSSRMEATINSLIECVARCPLRDSFQITAARAISRAFHLDSIDKAYRHRSAGPSGLENCFHQGCMRVYNGLEVWQKPLLHVALRELTSKDEPDGLQIVCGLLLQSSRQCFARRHHVFFVILERTGQMNTDVAKSEIEVVASDSLSRHCAVLIDGAQAAIDTLKDKAFKSVFLEPTKMYFRAVGDHTMEGDVEVHGSNLYLAILLATLGVKLNRSPLLSDEVKGFAAFTNGLLSRDLDKLWNPENVGKNWEAIFGRNYQPRYNKRVPKNRFFFDGDSITGLVNACLEGSSSERWNLLPYLDAFARYFSEEFVIEWLCTNFLANDRLLLSLNAVFRHVAPSTNEFEEADGQARYWFWDVMSGVFRRDRAVELFRFVGICKGDRDVAGSLALG